MGKACVYVPAKGKDTFRKLKKDFGYEQAAVIFNKIEGSDFMRLYGDKVTLDEEGIPTYESIMELPIVKDYVGVKARIDAAQKAFQPVEDTLSNTSALINRANEFNKGNKDFVGIVEHTSNGKINVVVREATPENKQAALDQYRILKLNEKMAELLAPAGITLQTLSSQETALGRVGHTQFVKVKDRADEFAVLLEAANNLEGAHAISEEFAHFVIGVYHHDPLVARSINFFRDEANARQVLGDQYESVYEYYNGNEVLIAEETAGHLFQQSLLRKADTIERKVPLLKRMVNRILSFFKGISPRFYKDSIDSIAKQYDELAQQIITGERKVTKRDINQARRIADFNALSEKAQAQVDALKGFIVREYKAAELLENLEQRGKYERSQKSKARRHADEVGKAINEQISKEESMAAIATYLTQAIQEIQELGVSIKNIGDRTAKDRFTILRNAYLTIQKYTETLKELRAITEPSFLSDEQIQQQTFVVEDSTDALKDYEVNADVEQIDTYGKTVEEVLDLIIDEASKLKLSDDETHYVNTETGQKSARVTTVIDADVEGHTFDPNSPWKMPATNIGTGIDELTRDFISGRITRLASGDWVVDGKPVAQVYPNATQAQLNHFLDSLQELQEKLSDKGITLVSRDITVEGTIKTSDGTGRIHRVSVAGTLDLLGYDEQGNWYIYDMKTHRSSEISEEQMRKYRRQLTEYKHFLERKFGIKVKEINVIPIKVSYDTPEGAKSGTAKYTVADSKPEGYNGAKPNQLLIDGKPFKGAYPKLEEVIQVEELNPNIQYAKLANDPTNGVGGGVEAVLQAVNSIQAAYTRFEDLFYAEALPQFIEFLKPFVGENITIADKDNPGKFKTVALENLVKEGGVDTTFMQYWLSSMADNPDTMLQIFDKIVKIAKDEKRIRTIEAAQDIIALGKKYESKGITSYEWMFEDNKMHYVNKLFDDSAYLRAKKAKDAELVAKYGMPEIGTPEFKQKKAEMNQWVHDNTIINPETGKAIPSPELYPSKYHSWTQTQRDFYDEWMEIKDSLDRLLGPNKTTLINSIKIRKSNIERLHALADGTAIQSFVDGVRDLTQRSFDDDYTRRDRHGIKNFDNTEFMKLPLYYINADEKDARDISTDVIGTLIAYADMAYNYDAMSQIVSPLEVGRTLMKHRKIHESRSGKLLKEKFKVGTQTYEENMYVDTEKSRFMDALDTFFESKIYGRYMKDYDDVAGIDKNKAASILLKIGSTVQLGFNIFANFANVLTGISMQNIEAAAGEFFKARELAAADKEFAAAMGEFLGDIGKRTKKSKLALFDQLFDVRQNFSSDIKHVDFLNSNVLTRIFGPGIQYIGQDSGDHWLYNRTAIALALRYKLLDTKTNTEVSLWDALETVPVDPNNPEAGNKIVIKDGIKKLDGSTFSMSDISEISGKMRYINQHLFGIYNQEDSIAARRTITGRFLLQYRDWIPAQFRYRFGSATTNLEKGGKVEGYYRTVYNRFIKQLYREVKSGESLLKARKDIWDSLEDYEKANVKRAMFEIGQYAVVAALCALLGKSKDKDRPWIVKMMRYALIREKTELGALTVSPDLSMLREGYRILKSPMAATNVLNDIAGLGQLIWIPNYFDELEAGDYKGHSTAYRAFFRSPLSIWYKTFRRISDPEKAEQYFE